MKLLAKSELNKKTQQQKNEQIVQASKIASILNIETKKINELRHEFQQLKEREMSLFEEFVYKISENKKKLQIEVSELELRKREALEPTIEREEEVARREIELKKQKKIFDSEKKEIQKQEDELEIKRKELLEKQKTFDLEFQNLLINIEGANQLSAEMGEQSADLQHEKDVFEQYKKDKLKEFTKKEADLALKEALIITREQALDTRLEKIIFKEKRVNDRYQTLLRSERRLNK